MLCFMVSLLHISRYQQISQNLTNVVAYTTWRLWGLLLQLTQFMNVPCRRLVTCYIFVSITTNITICVAFLSSSYRTHFLKRPFCIDVCGVKWISCSNKIMSGGDNTPPVVFVLVRTLVGVKAGVSGDVYTKAYTVVQLPFPISYLGSRKTTVSKWEMTLRNVKATVTNGLLSHMIWFNK